MKSLAAQSRIRGFDYGLLPLAAAFSTTDFPSKLSSAQIVAVAYGQAPDKSLRASVPEITLVGTNRQNLIDAFQEFHQWVKSSDGDALQLTFVFRSSAGYLLALSPESHRLTQRCMAYSRTLQPLRFFMAWIKRMDTVHPQLLGIRKYCKTFPSPVLVTAGYLPSSVPVSATKPDMVQEIEEIQPILKFEVQFFDEVDATPGSIAGMVLEGARERKARVHPKPVKSRLTPADIFADRRRSITTHFPVTLERTYGPLMQERINHFLSMGLRRWQIEQAVCNCVLSFELTGSFHYKGIAPHSLVDRVIIALNERYEMANMANLRMISESILADQLLADANSLCQYLGLSRRITTIPQALAALTRVNALDPVEVVGNKPHSRI